MATYIVWVSPQGLCLCGETQTMSHIVESCPLTKLNGSLSWLHSADEDAVSWLTSYGSWHAYEKKKSASQSGQTLWPVSQLLETARNVVIQVMPILRACCLLFLSVIAEQSPLLQCRGKSYNGNFMWYAIMLTVAYKLSLRFISTCIGSSKMLTRI